MPDELPKNEEPKAEEPAPKDVFSVDLTNGVDEALKKLRAEAEKWVKKGRYTKVRFKFRGKPLLPDMPAAAVLAAEAATFYWTGLLRALVFNLVGKSVLEVELIHDADLEVNKGREHLLSGDLDLALACFDRAIDMDGEHASAHLNRGVTMKLKGKRKTAARMFKKAARLDPDGEVGREAKRQLEALGPIDPPAGKG